MFDELANLLDVFIIILAANVLLTLVGRARYHEGLAINHLAKGDHFPEGACGRAIDPNDALLPLGDLPFCYHVLGVDPEELNSFNAAVFVDQKMGECFAITRGVRKLTAADGLVVDAALGEFGNIYMGEPYQIIGDRRFDINKLGLTRGPNELHFGALAVHYPASIMASRSGAPGSSGDHVTEIEGKIKSTILPSISEEDVMDELSRSANAPVSQLVRNKGDPLCADALAFSQRLAISEETFVRQIIEIGEAFQTLQKSAIDPEVLEGIGRQAVPSEMIEMPTKVNTPIRYNPDWRAWMKDFVCCHMVRHDPQWVTHVNDDCIQL
jgi:hypothetical protein